MTTIVVDGVPIRVDRSGLGPPVMLVHGLGGPAMWDRVAEIIRDEREVIVPHLPGFGESPAPVRPLDAAGHARLLGRFLDEAGLTGVTLAGTSYGGEIAALLAAASPGRIRVLVLICPTGTGRPRARITSSLVDRSARGLLRSLLPRPRIADALSRRSFHDPSRRPATLVDRYLRDIGKPGHLDSLIAGVGDIWQREGRLPEVVAGLRLPVRLVWGRNDRTLPVERSVRLRAAGDHVSAVLLEQCGHSAALEKPAEVCGVILGNLPQPTPAKPEGGR